MLLELIRTIRLWLRRSIEQTGQTEIETPAAKPSAVLPKKEHIPSIQTWTQSMYAVPPKEGETRFHDLVLPDEVMHAIALLGFQYCTPIQRELLPKTLNGSDATGKAQTGTGKTAAFIITILTHFLQKPISTPRKPGTPRALVLAPTRELVIQIHKDAEALGIYAGSSIMAVVGGIDYEKQKNRLKKSIVDIVVATPGRLLDFKKKGDIHLSKVEILVIDEADRMLDMGFIPDVRTIVHSTPPKSERQTLFFSATITSDVKRLASQWTKEPIFVDIMPEQIAAESVEQKVYITTKEEKFTIFYNLLTQQNLDRVIVFGNRKDETGDLAEKLQRYGIECGLLTGDVEQRKRMKRLEEFKTGKIRVLVATNVAARGLHIDGVSHVVNYNLSQDPEDYVHRIGRTGRAGASGISVSFADELDSYEIPSIEELLGKKLVCVYPEESLLTPLPEPNAGATSPNNISSSGSKNKKPMRKTHRRPPPRRSAK